MAAKRAAYLQPSHQQSFCVAHEKRSPAELGYPAELAAKEIVKREWRAWYDAYKSLGR